VKEGRSSGEDRGIEQDDKGCDVKEIIMKSTHIRLKFDLSIFLHYARRFSMIFVDRTKIQQVIHMKQHIGKLFNIIEPFHLLLNETKYLPPTEYVRVLEENETILLVLYFIILL